jgi:peroxiredoxin
MFCHRQMAQLCQEAEKLARSRNIQAVIIESHEPYRVRETLKQSGVSDGDIPLPILSDAAQTVAATYGVALQMADTIEWADRPASFLIDRDGILRYSYLARTSFNDRPPLEDLLMEQERMHASAALASVPTTSHPVPPGG